MLRQLSIQYIKITHIKDKSNTEITWNKYSNIPLLILLNVVWNELLYQSIQNLKPNWSLTIKYGFHYLIKVLARANFSHVQLNRCTAWTGKKTVGIKT